MTEKLESILEAESLSALLGKFNEQGVTDSILRDLTDSDLKELGVEKLGERKRLLAAFGKPCGSAAAVSAVEEAAQQGSSSTASSKTAATPADATKDSPWINSLGMPFVPIPRFETRFCIWPVRVQDYETYCMASGAKFPEIPFPQDSDHPIVGVTWNDAIEFCVWLTGKERAEGKIDDKTVYRLATDLEWSAAVGLPHEPEPTPAERHLKAPGYPWGLRWPPPRNAGNYEHTRSDQLNILGEVSKDEQGITSDLSCASGRGQDWSRDARILEHQHLIEKRRRAATRWSSEWSPVDDYEFTSEVGSFRANEFGIFDLGGNVWEWCMDTVFHKSKQRYVARGASFSMSPRSGLNERVEDYGIISGWERKDYLTIENQKVYSSSFRHICDRDASPFSEAIASEEYAKFISTEWAIVPCGGFRLVVATSA